jgi:hypothetical protein
VGKKGVFGDYLVRERKSDPDAMSCVQVSVFFLVATSKGYLILLRTWEGAWPAMCKMFLIY